MGCSLTSACVRLGQVPGTGEQLRVAGPLLNFLGCDPARGSWRGSVLLVIPPGSGKAVMAAQPTMTVLDEGADPRCRAVARNASAEASKRAAA